jgi:hypothetical protein
MFLVEPPKTKSLLHNRSRLYFLSALLFLFKAFPPLVVSISQLLVGFVLDPTDLRHVCDRAPRLAECRACDVHMIFGPVDQVTTLFAPVHLEVLPCRDGMSL